jgi:hypothetical protein
VKNEGTDQISGMADATSPNPAPSLRRPSPTFQPKDAADTAEFAARTLDLAGCVLATGSRGKADLRLAQLLLREAFVTASRVVANDATIGNLDEAMTALDTTRACAALAGDQDRIMRVAAELRASEKPRVERLLRAERELAKLVSVALGRPVRRKTSRWKLWSAVGVLVFVVVAVVWGPVIFGPRWEKYRWTASSADYGLPQSGTLANRGILGLLFHTAEELHPWILIDMLKTRSISRVIVKNRYDCCFDRGLPVVLEVSEDGKSFAPVGRQRGSFDVWTADFSAREARYVRIRSEATAAIHFRAIEIP